MNIRILLTTKAFLRTNGIALLLITGIILIQYFLPRDELRTIIIYLILVPIFVIYKLDSRIPILYSILLLVLSSIIYGYYFPVDYYRYVEFVRLDVADRLVVTSYYLLLIGISCVVVEFFRKSIQDIINAKGSKIRNV
jgi:hypothetical protein